MRYETRHHVGLAADEAHNFNVRGQQNALERGRNGPRKMSQPFGDFARNLVAFRRREQMCRLRTFLTGNKKRVEAI